MRIAPTSSLATLPDYRPEVSKNYSEKATSANVNDQQSHSLKRDLIRLKNKIAMFRDSLLSVQPSRSDLAIATSRNPLELKSINREASGGRSSQQIHAESRPYNPYLPHLGGELFSGPYLTETFEAIKTNEHSDSPGQEESEEPELKQFNEAIFKVAQLTPIQSGQIEVNGKQISIDTNSDSLADVLNRISDSSAGVTASYSTNSQRVSLEASGRLSIDSNTTRFFPTLSIEDRVYEPQSSKGILDAESAATITQRFQSVIDELKHVFEGQEEETSQKLLNEFRHSVIESQQDIPNAVAGQAAKLGIQVDFASQESPVIEWDSGSRSLFEQKLQSELEDVKAVLLGTPQQPGILNALQSQTEKFSSLLPGSDYQLDIYI